MFLHKEYAFLTEEDNQKLLAIEAEENITQDELYHAYVDIDEEDAPELPEAHTEEELKKFDEYIDNIGREQWEKLDRLNNERKAVLKSTESRYIASFLEKDNAAELIYRDAEEVAAAIDRADVKKMADSLKRFDKSVKEKRKKDLEAGKKLTKRRVFFNGNYNTAVVVIKSHLKVQELAANSLKIETAFINEIAIKRAGELYTKPKDKNAIDAALAEVETSDAFSSLYFNQPTSAAAHLAYKLFNNGGELEDLKNSLIATTHRKVEIVENKKMNIRGIRTTTSDNQTVTIVATDLSQLAKNNKAVKKLFNFALIKLNEQALFSGELRKECIEFPLKELVDIGFYNSVGAAREGFENAAAVLLGIRADGRDDTGKADVLNMFDRYKIENSICKLYPSRFINWNNIAATFAPTPKYAFSLSGKAYDLMYYICYLARQHKQDIRDKGYFNIGLMAIKEFLNLPDNTKNPQRDIKDKIMLAVDEIIKKDKTENNFKITIAANKNGNIAEYLKGYLRIEPLNNFREHYVILANKDTKAIEQREKKNERIVEQALIKNMQEKIKKDEIKQ